MTIQPKEPLGLMGSNPARNKTGLKWIKTSEVKNSLRHDLEDVVAWCDMNTTGDWSYTKRYHKGKPFGTFRFMDENDRILFVMRWA